METRPKVFIVSAHAAAEQNLASTARRLKSFYRKILLALALLLGVAGILSHQRFDAKTAIRAAVKVNAVVYENGRGTLVKSIGTLLSADGIVVTNFCNVGNLRYVWVQNSVGQTTDATIVAADPGTGLALLKIEGNNLPFVRLGEPGSVKVGATVHAIGSGAGLDFYSATGSVAGLDAPISALHQTHFIQTDISLSPDCVGNPLFDQRGNLVGIGASIGKAAEDCSFAIPIDLVHDLLDKYFSAEKSGNEVTTKSEAVLNTK